MNHVGRDGGDGPRGDVKDDDQQDENDGGTEGDHEFWRPSYMFHWLKSTGKGIHEAYSAFEEYQGRASYEQLGLKSPEPMPRDEDQSDGWSHMSDYDEFGLMPDTIELPRTETDIEAPDGETIERTKTPLSDESLGPKIVRSNRVGTTSDVIDHESTTHVVCRSSAEEATEALKSVEEIKDRYP